MSIASITRGLAKMVRKLDEHAEYQQRRVEVNNARIGQLTQDNKVLTTDVEQATKIANNIRKVLGE